MRVLLTYDIEHTTSTIHSELKERLIKHYGYSPTIRSSEGKVYQLTNTTLRKDGVNAQQSSSEFIQACRDVGAHWEKYIAAEYTNATFNNQD